MKVTTYDLSWLKNKDDVEYAINYCKDKKKHCDKNLKRSYIYCTIVFGALVGYGLNEDYIAMIFYLVYSILGVYFVFDNLKACRKASDLLLLLEDEYKRYIR